MARSKLERFRDAQFPVAPDQAGEPWDGTDPSPARPPPARPAAAPRRRQGARRSGRGPVGRLYGALKLALFLAPLAFLLLTTFVDCGPRPSSVVPDFMRSTACARRDLTRHALSIDGTLKLVSDRLR